MTQNNDVNNTNGASKEYWEARARNEREQAENAAFRRRVVKGFLTIVAILIISTIVLFLIAIGLS